MTVQPAQAVTTLNHSEVAVMTTDCVTLSSLNVKLEVIDAASSLPSHPAHLRIVQLKKTAEQIKVCLISDKNSVGKAGIRSIYEKGFNWKNWITASQEEAKSKGHPLTGYYCIDYVIQRETYLGESWEEACQQLQEAVLD
ncbi:MAG: hypothetical protein SWJ54_09085 [Cyanobacteriota bacterium]|nr:hypothetical protein [Cyanobacteriota bacterium]